MRIFDEKRRLHTNLDTISYYEMNEYNYYSNYNLRNFVFDDVEYSSLYRRLNVQLVVTNKCPYNCPFCIEKINPTNDVKENFSSQDQIKNLKRLLLTLKSSGMEPTVSITGGEPTLYLNHILQTANMLDDIGVMYNLNTSGFCLDPRIAEVFNRINLSVHSEDENANSKVFGVPKGKYWENEIFENCTIQRVITESDYEGLIRFINSFDQKRFSIRIVSRAEGEPSFDWKPLFDEIAKNDDFKFVQQKIGDYYFFEEYKYGPKLVRFSFSDLDQLKYYKDNYEQDKNYVRAAIVLADGSIKFDWINSIGKEEQAVSRVLK